MGLLKAQIARRQLGTALALYIDDSDPISVHVLACGGGEIAEQLALQANRQALSSMWGDAGAARQQRNLYWNAFKHATTKGGQDRADQELLGTFDDRRNDDALLVGWMDYFTAVGRWPLEAAVFQTWLMSWSFGSVDPAIAPVWEVASHFPEWERAQRASRKQRLRELIEIAKRDCACRDDPRNDNTPLMLPLRHS